MHEEHSICAIPRLAPGYLRRERLFGLLEAHLDSELVIVHAPAGGGKTNLVADWVRHRLRHETCLWVSLAHGEDLWSHLSRAAAQLFGVTGAGANDEDAADDETTDDKAADRETAKDRATRLAAGLNRANRPYNLVVDDFSRLTAEAQQGFMRFIRNLRSGRVIILSRGLDSASLPLHRVQLRTFVVGAHDLAYTVEEITELSRAYRGSVKSRTDHDPGAILAATGGHPLLVRLFLDSPDSSVDMSRFGLAVEGWASELVRPELRNATLLLAQVPAADARLAAQIIGMDDAERVLNEIAHDGLGAIDEEGFFEFHEAIGSALRRLSDRQLPEPQRQRARELATDYLQTQPRFSDAAIELLAADGNVDELWRMFAASFPEAMIDAVEPAFESLLPDPLGAEPLAVTIAAVLRSYREPVPSIELTRMTDRALGAFLRCPPASDPESAVFQELAVLALLWSVRRFEAGAERAQRLVDLTAALDPDSRTGVWQAVHWGLLGAAIASTLAGETDQALRLLSLSGSDREPRRAMQRTIQRDFTHAMRGEVTTAAGLLETLPDDISDSAGWSTRLAITRAAVQLEGGDAQEALTTLRSIEEQLMVAPEWAYALIVIARCHTAIDPISGVGDLDRLVELHAHHPVSARVNDILCSARADILLASGDTQRAAKIISQHGTTDFAQRLSAARIGLVAQAPRTIPDLEELTRQDGMGPRLRAQAYFLLAVHQHRAGNPDRAAAALGNALAITKVQGIRLIHSLVPHGDLEEIAHHAGWVLPANVNDADPLESLIAQPSLTQRETVLLHSLATKARLRDIAEREFVSLHTIKSQAASLYRKLGVRSREAAVREALRRGLFEASPVQPS